jgi:hypothetical protein
MDTPIRIVVSMADMQVALQALCLYWTLVHCVVAVAAGIHSGTASYVDTWYALPWPYRLLVLIGMPWVLPFVHFAKLLRGSRKENPYGRY